MSKKSKKRKHKRSSSSSSEGEEKKSKDRDATKNYKSAKRKQHGDSRESSSRRSHAEKRETCALSAVREASQSSRHIKKPVYRLTKTPSPDQKPVRKEEERRKTKGVTEPSHRGHCSSKAKHETSGKDNTASGSKTVDRGTSKPSNTKDAGTVPKRREETSKGSLDERSSHRSPSKSKTQLISPSLVSDEQKEQIKDALKREHRTEEPPRTSDDRNIIMTREPSETSDTSDYAKRKKEELMQMISRRQRQIHIKIKTQCKAAKTPSAFTTENRSTSAKRTTSVNTSNVVKDVSSTPGNVTSVSYQTAKPSSAQQRLPSLASPLPANFKIPKKVQPRPEDSTAESNNAVSNNTDIKHETELSNSGASMSKPKCETDQEAQTCLVVTPSSLSERQDERPSLSIQLPSTSDTVSEPWYDQMQVVEELHLARSEKRLDVMQSYGELTCMDIDPPEEGAAESHCRKPQQQDLILVLDTNILISHLDYVKKFRSHGLEALGLPVVLIPWVVLQELDSLKRGKGLSGSVAHLACPAISYIYNSLKSREPRLWGQSMQQAAQSSNDLNAENNDDRVLQCCLQYQSLYPECALILCTNDKNLCSKALLSGVKALSKNDLEAEVGRSRHGFKPLQYIKTSMLPHVSPQASSSLLSRSYTPVRPHCQQRPEAPVGLIEKDFKQQSEEEDGDETEWDYRCVSELEDCLQEVLSDVLEVEMKAAYDDLWLEIVYVKPPWTLQDVLRCFKKHWIAVFGQIVPRRMEQNVLNLIDFFNSGNTVDLSATIAAFQEAKELVKAFGGRSRRVPGAIAVLDNIFNRLQAQGESPADDVVMNDDDEDKQPTPAHVSHQEVWALFEHIWSNVWQLSMQVFKALGFDPHTMQSAQPAGGPPPPQDALVCLHSLSSVVSQLLQAFSRVLSSAPGSEEVHTLLSIIHSNKIVDVDSRLTADHLLDCFSQQDYREMLRVGGNRLVEMKEALDRCGWTFTSQS
uniref:transcriptional protein SWT1 n=1 Tax=Semicossyphus pulcher TaxID=241346 RepID=UPI0037E89F57